MYPPFLHHLRQVQWACGCLRGYLRCISGHWTQVTWRWEGYGPGRWHEMSTGGVEDGRVSTTGPGWGPLHAGERHAPRVTDTLTSAVQDGAWRGLKQHVAREDQAVQPRAGKPRQTSRGFRHRGKEETADRDCSQVQQGRHGCVTFTARNFKCEELVETCQSRPPVLANYFDMGVKALIFNLCFYTKHNHSRQRPSRDMRTGIDLYADEVEPIDGAQVVLVVDRARAAINYEVRFLWDILFFLLSRKHSHSLSLAWAATSIIFIATGFLSR